MRESPQILRKRKKKNPSEKSTLWTKQGLFFKKKILTIEAVNADAVRFQLPISHAWLENRLMRRVIKTDASIEIIFSDFSDHRGDSSRQPGLSLAEKFCRLKAVLYESAEDG